MAKLRRIGPAVVGGLCLAVVLGAGPAVGASSQITPSHQSRGHAALASWNASFQGNAGTTGTARFYYYGSGSPYTSWTTSGSTLRVEPVNFRFYPCNQTTYTQRLETRSSSGSVTSFGTATTTVQGGSPC